MCGIAGILYKERNGERRGSARRSSACSTAASTAARTPPASPCTTRPTASATCGCASSSARATRPSAPSATSRPSSPSTTRTVVEEDAGRHHRPLHRCLRRRPAGASPTRWSTSRQVASIGESLDIIKDVGGAHDVDRRLPRRAVHGHPRHRPRAARDRVRRLAGGRPPLLGDGLRRRRDRPQRPDHELLEDAPPAGEAQLRVQHRQRHRADRRLPGRQAGAGRAAGRRPGDVDPGPRRHLLVPRLDARTRSATRRTASPPSPWSCSRTTTSSRSPPRRSR